MSFMKDLMEEYERRGFGDINKNICADCIEDEYLKSWIEEHAQEEDVCDYCGEIHKVVDMTDLMYEIKKAIDKYYDDANQCMGWIDGEYVGNTYFTEEMFDTFAEYIGNDDVIKDITEALNDITWCKENPYGLSDREVYEYSWKSFSHLVKHKTRYFFFKNNKNGINTNETLSPLEILDTIAYQAKQLGLIKNLPINSDIYRARSFKQDEEVILDGKNLGAPPVKKAKTDRMSACGISVFYGSDNQTTALTEINNSDEELETYIAKFNNVRELTYLDLSQLPPLPSIFDLDSYEKREAILFFRDLNRDLTKPIEELKDIEYVPTQVFAEYFKLEEKIDGIKYASSKDKNGTCLVLFFDNEQCNDGKKEYYKSPCEIKFVEAKKYSNILTNFKNHNVF